MSLGLPTAERRAWIQARLDPLTSGPPDPATIAAVMAKHGLVAAPMPNA